MSWDAHTSPGRYIYTVHYTLNSRRAQIKRASIEAHHADWEYTSLLSGSYARNSLIAPKCPARPSPLIAVSMNSIPQIRAPHKSRLFQFSPLFEITLFLFQRCEISDSRAIVVAAQHA